MDVATEPKTETKTRSQAVFMAFHLLRDVKMDLQIAEDPASWCYTLFFCVKRGRV